MGKDLTNTEIQQTMLRCLRLEASSLRQQARSRRMSGPNYVKQRAVMREEASRCTALAQLVLRCDPQKLREVLTG